MPFATRASCVPSRAACFIWIGVGMDCSMLTKLLSMVLLMVGKDCCENVTVAATVALLGGVFLDFGDIFGGVLSF